MGQSSELATKPGPSKSLATASKPRPTNGTIRSASLANISSRSTPQSRLPRRSLKDRRHLRRYDARIHLACHRRKVRLQRQGRGPRWPVAQLSGQQTACVAFPVGEKAKDNRYSMLARCSNLCKTWNRNIITTDEMQHSIFDTFQLVTYIFAKCDMRQIRSETSIMR